MIRPQTGPKGPVQYNALKDFPRGKLSVARSDGDCTFFYNLISSLTLTLQTGTPDVALGAQIPADLISGGSAGSSEYDSLINGIEFKRAGVSIPGFPNSDPIRTSR